MQFDNAGKSCALLSALPVLTHLLRAEPAIALRQRRRQQHRRFLSVSSHFPFVEILLTDTRRGKGVYGPPDPNSTIGEEEGESVAFCTKAGYGTRMIPPGALKGVQTVLTPDYFVVAGAIDQSLINIRSDDSGGELDPQVFSCSVERASTDRSMQPWRRF